MAYDRAHFGQGAGPIVYDDLDCTGSEADIVNCHHRELGASNCDHSEDAGVKCGKLKHFNGIFQFPINE